MRTCYVDLRHGSLSAWWINGCGQVGVGLQVECGWEKLNSVSVYVDNEQNRCNVMCQRPWKLRKLKNLLLSIKQYYYPPSIAMFLVESYQALIYGDHVPRANVLVIHIDKLKYTFWDLIGKYQKTILAKEIAKNRHFFQYC
jgi:hypothetical protein